MVTIEEIRACDKAILTPADVSGVLQCNPQGIRDAARRHPEWFGFPVVCIGNRVKIPRQPFLDYWTGKT